MIADLRPTKGRSEILLKNKIKKGWDLVCRRHWNQLQALENKIQRKEKNKLNFLQKAECS
jgi:hypothetical protein